MGKRQRMALGALALLLAAGLAGCGTPPEPAPSPTATESPSPTPQARPMEFALPCYPQASFHPITGTGRTNLALAGLMYDGLYELDQNFEPQPALSVSHTVSENGLVWTFALRQGVTFSDGSPLTAAEIAASLNLARISPLYSARFAGVTDIAAANGMVTVTLSRANGALPALLDIPIVKETGGVPLGTGPYVLAGTGENLALEARSDWWQGKALPRDTIPLRAIQEADDLIHAFDTRDIALVSTDLTGTNALGFSGSFAAVDYPTSTMLYVGFNTADGPCRSAQVRQALLRGFDRAAVSTAQFSRHAQPAALPVSPASPLYDEALAQTLDYAPQAMEPLLTAAGYTRADGVWQKEGRPLALTFVAPNNNADRLAAAETLAANLTDAGLEVELRALAWDDYLQALTAGSFDLYLGEVRLTADFDLTAFLTPGGALNYGKYSDAGALNRLSAFRAAVGQWRTEPARQLYEYLAGQPPFAVICFKNWSVLTQWSRIDGLTPAQQNIFHQFSDWKIT